MNRDLVVRSAALILLFSDLHAMTRLFAGTAFDRPPKCDVCGELEEECDCPPPAPPAPERIPPEKQTAVIRVEKRKRGKSVTVIRGLDEHDLPDLVKLLKNKCGAGGSIQENTIEIQGNPVDRIRTELESLRYKVKG